MYVCMCIQHTCPEPTCILKWHLVTPAETLTGSTCTYVRYVQEKSYRLRAYVCTLVGQPFTGLHICLYVHPCPDMYISSQHANSCQRIKSYETVQLSLMRCHIQGCNTTAKYCSTYLQYTVHDPKYTRRLPFTTHHMHVVHFIEYHMCQSHKQYAHGEVSIQLTEMLIALSLLSV